jgi:hypothetical protein
MSIKASSSSSVVHNELELTIEKFDNTNAQRVTRAGFRERLGPFTLDILNAIPPVHLKSLKAKMYEGKTNPYLNVDSFKSIVTGKGYTMALLCHAFQETLPHERGFELVL